MNFATYMQKLEGIFVSDFFFVLVKQISPKKKKNPGEI